MNAHSGDGHTAYTFRLLPAKPNDVYAYAYELYHLLLKRGWQSSEANQYALAIESALLIAVHYSMPQPSCDSFIHINRTVSDSAVEISISHRGVHHLFRPVLWFSVHFPLVPEALSMQTVYARLLLLLTGDNPRYSEEGNHAILSRTKAG